MELHSVTDQFTQFKKKTHQKLMWPKYIATTISLGLVRNAVVMSTIPMKPDELYVNRLGTLCLASALSPVWLPMLLGTDLANIERKVRGLPMKPFVPFVY